MTERRSERRSPLSERWIERPTIFRAERWIERASVWTAFNSLQGFISKKLNAELNDLAAKFSELNAELNGHLVGERWIERERRKLLNDSYSGYR